MSININKGIGLTFGKTSNIFVGGVPIEEMKGEDVTLAEGVVLRGVVKMPIVKWTDETHLTIDYSNGGRVREVDVTSKKIKVSQSF